MHSTVESTRALPTVTSTIALLYSLGYVRIIPRWKSAMSSASPIFGRGAPVIATLPPPPQYWCSCSGARWMGITSRTSKLQPSARQPASPSAPLNTRDHAHVARRWSARVTAPAT